MKQTRPSNTSKQFVTISRVQADQKDVIIDRLQRETEALRKNQTDFATLRQQYADLDRKYRAQLEQKNLHDTDFKNRHDSALRYVGQLKNQADAIKAELRDKKSEVEDLQVDKETLRSAVEERCIELQKLRIEINALICDSNELENEREAFTRQQESLRINNSQLSESLFQLQKENEVCHNRLASLEKYSQQLEHESAILRQKIKSYEDINNDLDMQIQESFNQLGQIDNLIYGSQQAVSSLQIANATLQSNADQYKSEAIHNLKACQAEAFKNNELIKKLKQADHTIAIRAGQVEEGFREIEALKTENESLDESNRELSDDLEACQKHLQNLGLLNHQLIGLLENFSQEDRKVADIINREQTVQGLVRRVQQTSSIEFYSEKDTARTDVSVNTSRRSRF